MIEKITNQNFEDKVLKSNLPVFACFMASWCRSCFAFCLVTEDLAKEYAGRIKFVEIDVEAAPELMERCDLRVLPAVLLFKHSELVKSLLGFHYKKELKRILNVLIAGQQVAG